LHHHQHFSTTSRIGQAYAKAEHNRMCVVVTQTPQPVKLLLTGRVPQTEFNMCIIEENIVNIVFEDGRLVDSGKVAACKYVEE